MPMQALLALNTEISLDESWGVRALYVELTAPVSASATQCGGAPQIAHPDIRPDSVDFLSRVLRERRNVARNYSPPSCLLHERVGHEVCAVARLAPHARR